MNAVGIDVSKSTSTVAIARPFGEIVKMPFDVMHTNEELNKLARLILSLDGETRVVMENTGRYHEPMANALCDAGIFVSVPNAKILRNYNGDTIRYNKTDPIDSLKIATYYLDKWVKLRQYQPEDECRKTLKIYNRQLAEYTKMKVMLKNNLIALLDQTFAGVNKLFTSPARDNGHEKWIDFVAGFWHVDCVKALSETAFSQCYQAFCKKHGCYFSVNKANEIYALAKQIAPPLPKNDFTKMLVQQAISQLNCLCETVAVLKTEMNKLASTLPEYETVLTMHGVGKSLAPQLIAEIGDIRRFPKRTSLACFAGIEPPENQSGVYNQHSRRISKQGSPHLRRALFQAMRAVLVLKNDDEPTFQFIDRKRAEGKPFKVYMVAGCNKFLRHYYAKVSACYAA